MFAASRNDKVSGRTVILTVSIRIKNGFSHVGAPSGRKCAINDFGLCVTLDIIIIIHSGSPKDRVKIRCLDILIEYGFNPNKLTIISVINREEIDVDIDFRCVEKVRDNCWKMIVIINVIDELSRLKLDQNDS
jgi:hypothetical protein